MININKIKKFLNEKVLEQKVAKNIVINSINDIFEKKNKKTPLSFLLSGDSSSGKTHLANTIAKYLELEHGYSVYSVNMGQYIHENQNMDLIGVEYGYRHAFAGKLTSHIYKNPKTVVIIDNLDKAHHNAQNTLVPMILEGKLRDLFGFYKKNKEKVLKKDNYENALARKEIAYEVDCKDVIVIVMTRKGSDVYKKEKFLNELQENNFQTKQMLFESIIKETDSKVDGDYTNGYSPNMLSALHNMNLIPLFPLTLEGIIELTKQHILEKKEDLLEKSKDLDICFDSFGLMIKALVLSEGPYFDLRVIKESVARKVFNPIQEAIQGKYNVKKILLSFDSESVYNLENLLSKIQTKDILKEMFKKNLSVVVSFKSVKKGEEIFISLHVDREFKKVIKATDYNSNKQGSFVLDIPDVKFCDVAGHNEVKEQLKEIYKFMKNQEKLEKYGISLPKGFLLYGEPGTGKTMLAKAFANQAQLPFIATTGIELMDVEVLESVFRKAREYSPSIIFIDEIDALGKRNGERRDIIINQLLTELDGFSNDPEELVFVIAATNFKSKIDKAILRSGRIDLHIEVPILDIKARQYFFTRALAKQKRENIDIQKILFLTADMTGADLQKIIRESALEAIRQDKTDITQEILLEQINRQKYGEKIISKTAQKTIQSRAYHEAGHAVIGKILMPNLKVGQITIASRSENLGAVSYNLEDSNNNYSIDEIHNIICMSYAGRLAQVHKFGRKGIDSGSSSDLEKAMHFAYIAIGVLGMDEELGYINVNVSHSTSYFEYKIQEKVHILLQELKQKTELLVKENWSFIDKVARDLILNESIDDKKINNVFLQEKLKDAS